VEANVERDVFEAIEAFSAGEIVVVVDDEGRENEGDLVIAAVKCTPRKMAFIVRHTCGIVCVPLTAKRARDLDLDQMVRPNSSPHGTAFTVSVDVRLGSTTGISAKERCNTALALADPEASAEDFVRPGHVFPLVARDGGVLSREGHTEAAVDLCALADFPPVGVICELVNDDGSVMKGPQITEFARTHGLKRLLIDDLVAFRRLHCPGRRSFELGSNPPTNPWGKVTGGSPLDGRNHGRPALVSDV
jgi:3,4-dihydroxy 2-butanone 4-phosphate synthase / GTP cyclohydrolase II